MTKRSSQRSKSAEMSTSSEVPNLMWSAFPPRVTDNRKSWLAGVARSLGWNQRRVKALFYCEARVVTADEWRTLNERLDAAKNREKRADELRATYRGLGAGVPVAARADDESAALPFTDGASEPRKVGETR